MTKRVYPGFNYCFWAKLLVAIPAIPLLGVIVSTFFTDPDWKLTAVAYSGALAVILANRIDRIPYLQRTFNFKS